MGLDLHAFLDEFRTEATEHLRALDAQLLALERDPSDPAPIRAMFLAAHSLKGAGAMMDIADVEALAHAVEDVLTGLRDASRRLDPPTADLLFRAVDLLGERVARGIPGAAPVDPPVAALAAALAASADAPAPLPADSAPPEETLPASPAPAASPPSPPVAAVASARSAPRALLVEDSATVRQLHAALLAGVGFAVDSVADAHEALALSGATPYALVVVGLETRGLRGPALAARLAQRGNAAPPCLLTSNAGEPIPPPPGVVAVVRVAAPAYQQLAARARDYLPHPATTV